MKQTAEGLALGRADPRARARRRASRCRSSSQVAAGAGRYAGPAGHRTAPHDRRRAAGRIGPTDADKLQPVALLFGGRSSEHSISCATAGGVLGAIDRDRYEVDPDRHHPRRRVRRCSRMTPTGSRSTRAPARGRRQRHARALARSRRRRASSRSSRRMARASVARRRRRRLPDPARAVRRGRHRAGPARAARPAVRRQRRARVGARHGQALHEDRARGRRRRGRAVGDGDARGAGRATASSGSVAPAALGLPVFVKPARAGSSVGVTQGAATGRSSTRRSTIAFAEDGTVLIEAAVVGPRGRVRACSQGRDGGAPRVSVAGEIVVTGREFYDFDAKYLDAPGVELVCPADLGDGELVEMQRIARARVRGDRRGGARAGRLLPRRRGLRRQRDQHDAGLHADLDVPDLLARLGAQLPRAHHRADRGRASHDGSR